METAIPFPELDTTYPDGREAIRFEMATNWDHDEWESALSNFFGLCSILHLNGGHIPADAQYKPGPCVADEATEYPDSMYAEMLDDGEITLSDMTFWVEALVRFCARVPEDRKY